MSKTRATAATSEPAGHPSAAAVPAPLPEKPNSPRSTKGIRTRERLVDAAKEIFEEHGFLNARISDIAERAGQSHGSFYYYFQSKEEIFREVAAAVDQRLFASLGEVILAESRMPVQQRIHESMRRYLESYRQEARIMGLIEHVARFDPQVNALRLARHQRHTEQVADIIKQLQRRKLADPKLDPMIAAAALGGLSYRFAEMWFVHGAIDTTLKHATEQLSLLFANSIRLKAPDLKG